MTFLDFLIVYLSIGASFGVYFFLNSRRLDFNPKLLLKTIGVVFGWCFYAAHLILRKSPKILESKLNLNAVGENKVEELKSKVLAFYSEISIEEKPISFFQFRETIERYAGLTQVLQKSIEPADFQNELFVIANGKNGNLPVSNRCLQRKNLLRLKAHQIQARQNFVQVVENSFENASEIKLLESFFIAVEQFVIALDDPEAEDRLNKLKPRRDRSRIAVETRNTQQNQISTLYPKNSTLNQTVERAKL